VVNMYVSSAHAWVSFIGFCSIYRGLVGTRMHVPVMCVSNFVTHGQGVCVCVYLLTACVRDFVSAYLTCVSLCVRLILYFLCYKSSSLIQNKSKQQ